MGLCSIEKDSLTKILSGKDSNLYFGDHPSLTWRQGINNQQAPSSLQTRKIALDNIDWYYKNSYSNMRLRALAHTLELCTTKSPCFNGACVWCKRAVARFIVKNWSDAINTSESDYTAVNMCLQEFDIPFDKALTFKTKKLKNTTNSLILRSGFSEARGAIDYSFNEEHRKSDSFLLPHMWLFVKTQEYERYGKYLRHLVGPASASVPRPIYSRSYNGDIRALAYAFKNTFDRRISYDFGNGRNTRKRDLTCEQRVILALLLSQEPLAARLYYYERA